MKKHLLFGFLFAISGALMADQPSAECDSCNSYAGSPEFERLKALAGTWTGETDMGEGPVKITVEYRVVAGGSAVQETFLAGTPKEMITMYTEKEGVISLTHYCMLHNQPAMKVKEKTADTLTFDFNPACGVDPATEMHMHSLDFTFHGPDKIEQVWTLYANGEAQGGHPFVLERVKS